MGMGEDILVVKKELLFRKKQFKGFIPIEEENFLPVILENLYYQKRTDELERNEEIQQPIPYVWLVNPEKKQIFLYKRSKTGNEGRLYDKYSGGVGGHIDRSTEGNSQDPVYDAMMRELKEEVYLRDYPTPKVIGFIKLDGGVEAVHFGIVAIAHTSEEPKPAEDMDFGRFYSLEEAIAVLENPSANIEKWTQISWPAVKKIVLQSI